MCNESSRRVWRGESDAEVNKSSQTSFGSQSPLNSGEIPHRRVTNQRSRPSSVQSALDSLEVDSQISTRDDESLESFSL